MSQRPSVTSPPARTNALGIPETATPAEARALLERLAASSPPSTLEEIDARLDAVAPVGADFPSKVDELIAATTHLRRGEPG